MAITAQSLVEEVKDIASPPDVWIRINDVMRDTRATAHDIASIIQSDPGLTSNILRVVNSAYYNFPSRIDTVSRAISIIGVNDLFNMITAITAVKVFSGIPSMLTNPDKFWKHSIATGILAKKVARKCNILHAERLYVAGMLHDIGCLVLYNKQPDKASEALAACSGDEEVLAQVEQELLGFNHADVGGELLKLWQLPDALVRAVQFHHVPAAAGDDSLDASIVHIANVLANRESIGGLVDESELVKSRIDPGALELTGLKEDGLDAFSSELWDEMRVALSVIWG